MENSTLPTEIGIRIRSNRELFEIRIFSVRIRIRIRQFFFHLFVFVFVFSFSKIIEYIRIQSNKRICNRIRFSIRIRIELLEYFRIYIRIILFEYGLFSVIKDNLSAFLNIFDLKQII